MSMGFDSGIVLTQDEKRFLKRALLNPDKEALRKRDLFINEIKSCNYERIGYAGFSVSIPKKKFESSISSIWGDFSKNSTERKVFTSYVTSYASNVYNELNVDDLRGGQCTISSLDNNNELKKYREENNSVNDGLRRAS